MILANRTAKGGITTLANRTEKGVTVTLATGKAVPIGIAGAAAASGTAVGGIESARGMAKGTGTDEAAARSATQKRKSKMEIKILFKRRRTSRHVSLSFI